MTDEPLDPEIAVLAAQLDAERPRPGRGLRQRVRTVLATGIRQRVLRRQAALLVTGGTVVLVLAAVLALNAPS